MVHCELLVSEHLAQLEAASQLWQVWLIRVLVLELMRAVPKGQVKQLPVLEQLFGTHCPLTKVYP